MKIEPVLRVLDRLGAAALLAIGDRSTLVAEVEGQLKDVQPNVPEAWRQVLAMDL